MRTLSISIRKNLSFILILSFLLFLVLLTKIVVQEQLYALYIILFIFLVIIAYYSSTAMVALFLFSEIGFVLLSQFYSFFGFFIGPVAFTLPDICGAVACIVLVIRFAKSGLSVLLKNDFSLAFIIFIALIVIGIFRGVNGYGKSAFGDIRYEFWFCSLVLYLGTCKLSKTEFIRLFRFFGVFSCILAIIGLLRALGIIPYQPSHFGTRVLNCTEALFLLFIFLALVVIQINGKRHKAFMFFLSFVLLLSIIMLRHRSVWLGSIIGTITLLFMFRTTLIRFAFPSIALVILLICLFSIGFPLVFFQLKDLLVKSAKEPLQLSTTESINTASGRLTGWVSLLNQLNSTTLWMIGKGYGDHFNREMWGGKSMMIGTPHNAYIQIITREGIIGLTTFIFFVYKLEKKIFLIRRETKDEFTYNVTSILFVCILASLGYMIGYGLEIPIGIPFGIAFSYAMQREQVSDV